MFSFSTSNRITIRQILDPYVDDVQCIAQREVTLESNGDLCMSKIGLGMPGDRFFVGHTFNFLTCIWLIVTDCRLHLMKKVSQ